MSTVCVEGWAQMDGLLSGPTPSDPMDAQALVEAVEEAAQEGLRASLDLDGGRFHLLVDDQPFLAPETELAGELKARLDRVLSTAKVQSDRCESTVRLRRWTRGEEQQTLFVPGVNGLQAMTRSVECATMQAPPKATLSRRRWLELAGIIVAAGLAWFVLQRAAPANWMAIEIDPGAYADYMSIEPSEAGLAMRLSIDPAQLETLHRAASPASFQAWITEDLLRGRLRYRFVDDAGQTLGQAWYGVVFDGPEANILRPPPPGAARIEFLR